MLSYSLLEKEPLRSEVQLEAPIIGQYPQLPRGYEVTSLATLLQYASVEVNKMELAERRTKARGARLATYKLGYSLSRNNGWCLLWQS